MQEPSLTAVSHLYARCLETHHWVCFNYDDRKKTNRTQGNSTISALLQAVYGLYGARDVLEQDCKDLHELVEVRISSDDRNYF